ncbi:MAG: hypothetical protein AB7O67_23340 [Vicinamibacterales bacterium]
MGLTTRGLPATLAARIRAAAGTAPIPATIEALLTEALDARDARARGARAVNARLSPEARSASAKRAAAARWKR